jgi:glycosyltransferase involved in cell wall biosynthesis
VLSYTTRGMEPLRGFPEFLQALPALLQARPDLQVVVAGRDRQAYSYPAPSHNGSWKEHLLAELGPFPGRERIHFTGLIPYGQLRALMQRTDLHVYFSRPYVTSWSLFEAAACGAPIAMNESPATTGVLPDAAFARITLEQPATIAPALLTALERSLALRGQQRHSRLPDAYADPACLSRWQELVNAALQAKRTNR